MITFPQRSFKGNVGLDGIVQSYSDTDLLYLPRYHVSIVNPRYCAPLFVLESLCSCHSITAQQLALNNACLKPRVGQKFMPSWMEMNGSYMV